MVNQEHPVQVVQLVLEEPGLQFISFDRQFVAIEVNPHEVHRLGADDLPGQAGYRETALFEDPLAVRLHDPRVQDHPGGLTVVVDEEALLHAHLWGGQTDPGGLVHRLEHFLAQAYQSSVNIGHISGRGAQDGVADDPDLMVGHGPRLPSPS